MRRGAGRMIEESSSGSIRTLILSNEKLSVKILAGKGGDINQITYLPEKAELLHTENENFSHYENRDLSITPLSRYSEHSTGGWQDVVPGYGRYGSLVFGEYPVGTAATLPWDYQAQAVDGRDARNEKEVNLSVHLPEFPLFMKKQIRLEDEVLILRETIRNEGSEPADFTWTQHSAFGGGFLDEQVEISYPGEEIFLSSLYVGQGGKKEEYFKNISCVPMPDGVIYNLKNMREPKQDGHLIFTMKAGAGEFSLYHKARKFGFRVDWDRQIFPYIRCWYQNTKEGYSFAIEPCNYAYSSFMDTDKENMYLHLEAGEEMSTEIRLSIIHQNKEEG